MTKQKVHLVSMGCVKNLVDSEKLLAQLQLGNIEIARTLHEADVTIINTCGFIEDAKRESIDAILDCIRAKSNGKLRKVYAMGCLTERYREELRRELPELDGVFGSNELGEILRALGTELKYELLGERVRTTPRHYAYLKISEGCDNPCSFCAIPLMRGTHVSRSREEIVSEATILASGGTKELMLIAQDTTCYGLDRTGRRELDRLLAELAGVKGIDWIRLLYAYPAKFPLEILDVIRSHPTICRYLDMPVQHSSDAVLKSMRRGISSRALRRLIGTIRERVPGIALRTTVIVGYPTETTDAFDDLLAFIEETRFARLGVFMYSREEGTSAFALDDPVPRKEKDRRMELVMELQREISEEENRKLVGRRMRVLLDRREDGRWIGRTERDAPEIDNEVYVDRAEGCLPGDFLQVDILDSSEYDLYGVRAGGAEEAE